MSDSNILANERPGIIQSSTSPSATIYYIDFEAARILPLGPGSGIRINDFYSAGGGKYIPPEGVDALDPYAYDIYCLGMLYDAIFGVSHSSRPPGEALIDCFGQFTSERKNAKVRISRCIFDFADMLRADNPAHRPSIFRVNRLLRALQAWVFATKWLYWFGRADYVYAPSPFANSNGILTRTM